VTAASKMARYKLLFTINSKNYELIIYAASVIPFKYVIN